MNFFKSFKQESQAVLNNDYIEKLSKTSFKCKTFYFYECNRPKTYPHIMKIIKFMNKVSIYVLITIPGIKTLECDQVYDYVKFVKDGYIFNSFVCRAVYNNDKYNINIKFTDVNYLMVEESEGTLFGEMKLESEKESIPIYFVESEDEESFKFINEGQILLKPFIPASQD